MTRAEVRTWVQNMGFGTDTATQQNDMLLRAYVELAGRRAWSWLEKTAASTITVATNTVVATPSDLLLPTDLYINIVDEKFPRLTPLPKDDFEKLRQAEPSTNRGTPRYWFYYPESGSIRVYPTADRTYTTSLTYTRGLVSTEFDDDADIPTFDTRFHLVLGWRVVQWHAFRQRDWAMHDRAADQYDKLLREMEQQERVPRDSGHMRRSDYWDNVKPWLAR